ncbi:MAG: hypothetical protein LBC41_18070, partial [Clostridiales bacterium]|nr:hypothetical protein [Clostridiales bacterium]
MRKSILRRMLSTMLAVIMMLSIAAPSSVYAATAAPSGNALVIAGGGGSINTWFKDVNSDIQANTDYTISMWVKGTGRARLVINKSPSWLGSFVLGSGTGELDAANPQSVIINGATEWTETVVTWNDNGDTGNISPWDGYVDPKFYSFAGDPAENKLYIDNLTVTKGEADIASWNFDPLDYNAWNTSELQNAISVAVPDGEEAPPDNNAPPANPEPPSGNFDFVDDMTQGLELVYKSENFKLGALSVVVEYWYVNYEDTPYGGWNTSTNAYIIYEFDKPIEDFEIIFYNYIFDADPLHEIKAFVSADDTTYTEVSVSTEDRGNSNYTTIPKHVLTPSGTIPASSYYLKLTSTALTGWSTKSGKLIKVSVATGEEEEGQGEEEVPSDGFDFVDDMTQGLALVYKAENFKIGELSEVAEYWNVNYENTPYGGWNTSTNAYIVYKFDKQIE